MLTALHIQDFVLIDQASLALEKGLTALTGETGAGKSILLDALGLAAGGRAERGAIRRGAKQGVVSATFEPLTDHPVWALLEENGLAGDDQQIILRRVQTVDGRGRAFINDQPVSIAMLRQVGETLLEIHGQHDGRGFLTAPAHRGMLDEFGALQKKTAAVNKCWREWRDIEAALDERKRERDATAREADYLRHVADELAKLDPHCEEEKTLAARRSELMAAEKVSADLQNAAAVLDKSDIEGKISSSLHRIQRAAASLKDDNPLSAVAEKLTAALDQAMEARAAIDHAISQFGGDNSELESTEERLFALRAAARKHGVTPDMLPLFLAKTQQALKDVESGEAAFGALEKELKQARGAYERLAVALTKDRIRAGAALDKAVMSELAPLKLGKACFETRIVTDEARSGAEGFDHVEFMVATNPGAAAGPLRTIASGGELSRFVLAMKAALAAKENRTVIIFDEVDAGVGGAVADAVGERLARLAGDAQVLVVTHSPQVAARAANHWRIEKNQTKKSTVARVMRLDHEDRVEEIARMLSGAQVTKEARAAAAKLLGAPAAAKKILAKKKPVGKRAAAG